MMETPKERNEWIQKVYNRFKVSMVCICVFGILVVIQKVFRHFMT